MIAQLHCNLDMHCLFYLTLTLVKQLDLDLAIGVQSGEGHGDSTFHIPHTAPKLDQLISHNLMHLLIQALQMSASYNLTPSLSCTIRLDLLMCSMLSSECMSKALHHFF